jgi:hypothetical protein
MTTTQDTYEHHFITNDGPIFHLIEDERGDIFWGYGHREEAEFLKEVERWLTHVGADPQPDSFAKVEHLHAKYQGDDEHFALADPTDPDAFPVTRVWL